MPSPSFYVAFTAPALPDHLRPTLIVRVWGFRVVYGAIHLIDRKGGLHIVRQSLRDGFYPINGYVYSDCTVAVRGADTPDFLWDILVQQAVELESLNTDHVS